MGCQTAIRSKIGTLCLALGLGLAAWSCSNPTTTKPDTVGGEEGTDDAEDGSLIDADSAGVDSTDKDSNSDGKADIPPGGVCAADVDCEKLNDGCKHGVCGSNKKCQLVNADDGIACDDGKACTINDKCGGGTCVGSTEGACNDKACQVGSCATDNSGKCEYVKAAGGTACDDGDSCTSGDTCAAGSCIGGPAKDCSDGNPCTADTCDKTGCVNTPTAGIECNDGDQCTTGDTCAIVGGVGLCTGPTPVVCDDKNECTTDSCNKAKGCVFANTTGTVSCVVTDACQEAGSGVCSSGKCTGKPDPSIDDGNPCTEDKPKVVAGQCAPTHTPKAGAACDDADPCVKNEVCDSTGTCKGTILVCNDQNPCTSDECDPKICIPNGVGGTICGQCAYLNLAEGATCTDNNACTSADSCSGGKCTGKDYTVTGQCDDKNDCTSDSCQPGGGCIHVPKDGLFCNDGDPCTTVDKCAASVCKGTAKDCKDTNSCTTDTCDATTGVCGHAQFTGPCDDGDACTQGDVCAAGVCDGTKVSCDDGNPCTSDVCDTVKGCIHLKAAGGTPCDDGLSCTTGDYCDSGKCVAQKDSCTSCNGDVECKALDDNNFCNGVVKCITGHPTKAKVCAVDTKTVVKCDVTKDTECSKNTCNPDNGSCAVVLKNEGAPCSGSDKCIDNATCTKQGACVGVTAVCDDKNDCTADSCDKIQGCLYKAKTDGATCDDKNVCTPASACQTGQCVGSENTCFCNNDSQCATYDDGDLCNGLVKCLADPKGGAQKLCQQAPNSAVTCPALDGKPCQDNACDTKTGQCVAKSKLDGSACNDQNACTIGETCASGTCSSTKKADCSDSNACTVDVCDTVFGCANAPAAKGGLCNDNDACTQSDNCDQNGNCTGNKLNCDDGNPCTIDVCDKVKGCTALVQDGSACDDGDPCTTNDACKDAKCAGAALDCNDNNSCTVDACDGKGGCKNVLIEGKDCTDGDSCTVGDTCTAGKCVGKVKSCDDNNPCTTDACDKGSCVITPAVGKGCDDGNSCTFEDACDISGTCAGKALDCKTGSVCLVNLSCSPVTGCVNVPTDGKPCSDNDSCTINDTCAGGGCQGVKLNCDDGDTCTADACDPKIGCQISQNLCDDNNPCTIDTCDKVKGCQHEVTEGNACTDGNKCHEKGQCSGGSCVTKNVVCDDKNSCTLDSCDAKSGCVYAPADPTTVTCDDGNPCTQNGCDLSGVCTATDVKCDDGNPCTVDSCNILKGCVVTDAAENSKCDDGDTCTSNTKCQGGFCSGGTVTCGTCKLDADCGIYDNNNKCDGTFSCQLDKNLGFNVCVPLPDPVTCDTTGDTACTANQCNPSSGKCELTQQLNGTKCEDGKGCTVGDTCTNGKCVSGQPNTCSTVKDACNDATCVEDPTSQAGFACVAMPKQGSVTCDADGSGCTANDFCALGKCVKGAAVDCTGVAKVCEVSTCKSTGANSFSCQVSLAADNTACDDGQLCTEGDFCKTGKCIAGTKPHDCSVIAGTCATGTCDKSGNGGTGACVPQAQNEGKPCDADSNGCTTGDKCISGTCVPGLPPDCDAQAGACTTGACKSNDAGTYQCIGAPKADKLPCEADNNGCTIGDACASGKCTAGSAKDCSALNSKDGCQVGTCKSLGSSQNTCIVAAAPIGQTCDADGNGCTKGDSCNKDGACIPGAAVDCLAFGGSCATGVCGSTGPATFTCSGTPKADGSACDGDQNGCTVGDKCAGGKCIPGPAPDCSAKAGTNVCLVGKCLNAGSDKYQCDAGSVKDGTTCDADGSGCTVDDSCQLGFCTKGDLQTCSAFAGLCGDAACQSTGTNAYKCNVTPKESYPPLDPPVACTTTDVPVKCNAGYTCQLQNATTKAGLCTPKTTVYCDDKDLCTEADVCLAGKCSAGKQKDCDDKDPCTLDSCKAGKCSNTAIAGCVACINEKLDSQQPKGWVELSTDATYVNFVVTDKAPFDGPGNMRATWVGPAPATDTVQQVASLKYRRMYVESSQNAQLEFYLAMTVANQDCGNDDFEVIVNGVSAFTKCDSVASDKYETGTKYQHITLDLSAYIGSHVDLEFRVTAGISSLESGTVDVDSVRLTGACGPGCLGLNFELTGDPANPPPEDPLAGALPQPARIVSTVPTYANWTPVSTGAHTLKSEMLVKYSGAPAGGAPVTTTLTIPAVRPVPGDVLWFAVKTTGFGDTNCGADDLVVTLGGKSIYTRCDNTGTWKTESVDLAAFASQTVDLVFTVTTGSTPTSKGTVELDDVAIAGKCTYACYKDPFDSLSSTYWTLTSTAPSVIKLWSAVSTTPAPPISPPKAAFASYDAVATPTLAEGAMTSAHSKGQALISVLGGTYSYSGNIFIATSQCDTGGNVALLRLLVNYTPATKYTGLLNDADGNVTLAGHCKSTTGWSEGPFTGELGPSVWGRPTRPSLVLGHPKSNAKATAYFDDLTIMCR